MTPSFSTMFKSFYYSNTYLPPVDLSDQGMQKNLLSSEDPDAAIRAQQLISDPKVKSILSEPLTYELDSINEKNSVLEESGFKLLSVKPLGSGMLTPFYSVVEHDRLKGWVIKSGAARFVENQFMPGPTNDRSEVTFPVEEESLLRIEMANRISRIARESNIDILVPKKRVVPYANLDGESKPTRKYCILCEKLDILGTGSTVQAIREMDTEHQRKVAIQIATLIQKVGLVDASFHNIRLTPNGRLAIIDTEPFGLMVAKKPTSIWRNPFFAKGASVEKCARVGLYTLMQQSFLYGSGLEGFQDQLKSEYKKIAIPSLSKWKIALSIASLGLIPLCQAIAAFVMAKWAKEAFDNIIAMDKSRQERADQYMKERVPEAFTQNHLGVTTEQQQLDLQQKIKQVSEEIEAEEFKQRGDEAKRYFTYTEGVPYSSAG